MLQTHTKPWSVVDQMADRPKPNPETSAKCRSNFGWKKGGKRLVYRLDYFLLIFAYLAAHTVAYLPFTEKAESCFLSQLWLILRAENIASPRAS